MRMNYKMSLKEYIWKLYLDKHLMNVIQLKDVYVYVVYIHKLLKSLNTLVVPGWKLIFYMAYKVF